LQGSVDNVTREVRMNQMMCVQFLLTPGQVLMCGIVTLVLMSRSVAQLQFMVSGITYFSRVGCAIGIGPLGAAPRCGGPLYGNLRSSLR
jgi:hypothetical protein